MHSGRLEDYPGLVRWYGRRRTVPPPAHSPEHLLFATCRTLEQGTPALLSWIETIADVFGEADDPPGVFESAKDMASTCEVDLMDLISEFGETALESGLGRAFQESMQTAAEYTGSISLRFLSAWSALNAGNLAKCISECATAGEDFAPINAVRGQACLERGQPEEAIRVLNLAVKQSPTEVLAWFQLAKAHHVLDRQDSAWNALLQCRRLAPQSHEVGLFMAMVAVSDKANGSLKASLAWDALEPALGPYAGHAQVVLNLLRLAALLGEEAKATDVIERAAWTRLVNDPDFLRMISGVLRALERRGWMVAARELLIRTTEPLAASS